MSPQIQKNTHNLGGKNIRLKIDEESLLGQISRRKIEILKPKIKRRISNNSHSPKSNQINFVNQSQIQKFRQPLIQTHQNQTINSTQSNVDTDQIIKQRNNRSKLKEVLLRQRSKCHSTQCYKSKHKPPQKLTSNRLRGRSIGHTRFNQNKALLIRNQLPSNKNTPKWRLSQPSSGNDQSTKQISILQDTNSNFLSRKRYSEDSSFKKKISNNLKHQIRIRTKDENIIVSRQSVEEDLVETPIRASKGTVKIDLNTKIKSQFKQKIRKEIHGKSQKQQKIVAGYPRAKTKLKIPQNSHPKSNQTQSILNNNGSNHQLSTINTKMQNIQNKNKKVTQIEVKSGLKDTEPKQNRQYHSNINQLLNTLQDMTNPTKCIIEADPLSQIKRIQNQTKIEKENRNTTKPRQNNNNIERQMLTAEEREEFVNVVRVRYNGNNLDLEDMPVDGKVKRYLKEIGYSSFEEDGKKGMRRRSCSRHSVSSGNRSFSGICNLLYAYGSVYDVYLSVRGWIFSRLF